MPRRCSLTDAQMKFLRECVRNPQGFAEHWPGAVIFRRWMRRITFRRAMKSVREALRFQQELDLSAAGATASHALRSSLNSSDPDLKSFASQREQIQALSTVVKLSHDRERLGRKYEKPEPEVNRVKETERQIILRYLRWQHPKQPAIALIADLDRPDLVEKEKRELEAQKQKRPAA